VWIPNLGALPIIASVSLAHIPCLFACLYESVSCLYDFFSTCLSTCVASAAWFLFGFVIAGVPSSQALAGVWSPLWEEYIYLYIKLDHLFVLFLLFLRIQYISLVRCSCYAYDHTHMSVLIFYLHVYYSDSWVCVSKHVEGFPSFSIFVHIHRHFHVYCLYCVLYL